MVATNSHNCSTTRSLSVCRNSSMLNAKCDDDTIEMNCAMNSVLYICFVLYKERGCVLARFIWCMKSRFANKHIRSPLQSQNLFFLQTKHYSSLSFQSITYIACTYFSVSIKVENWCYKRVDFHVNILLQVITVDYWR